MIAFLNRIRRNEPIRVRLYSAVVLITGYLVARGVIDQVDATFVGALALIVLGVETARARVTPTEKRDAP